jgi:hypothetical protein
MNSPAFPPADALIAHLKSINYQKHFNNYMDTVETVCLTIAAIVYVIFKKTQEWYQNGGKDATLQIIKKVWNFLSVSYTWVRCEVYPAVIKFLENVSETYGAWRDLVTVA